MLLKYIILFLLFTFSSLVSQTKTQMIRFLKIDPGPCINCKVFINGKYDGMTSILGLYEFIYDTTKENKYDVEVVDTLERVSKKFTMSLGKGKNKVPGNIVFFTLVRTFLNENFFKEDLNILFNYYKETGITDVFIPVFFNGATIYPSKVKGIKTSKNDYLKEILLLCKKFNIRPYASINTLNWGTNSTDNSILKDLLLVNKKGEYRKGPEADYLFVSPVNPEVIRILTEINIEVATNYPELEGINYNYCRFKKGSYLKVDEEDFGFEKTIVSLFKENYNYDPYKIKYDTSSNSIWNKWIEFKENLILNLLIKMTSTIKNINKNFKITLNIDPSYVFERGLNLTCVNPYDIEEYIVPDHYFLEVNKKYFKNDLRLLDFYLPTDDPFARNELMLQRRNAFIPLIYDENLNPTEMNKYLELLIKKGVGANFAIYNDSILHEKKNRKLISDIMFR